jgi:N-acetylmuramoyl-L-alanine amidase
MDSEIDYPVITSDAGQTAYAKAVAEGLIEFLGLTKKAAIPTPAPTATYTKKQCVKDIQTTLGGLTVDGICGSKTLSKLPTISKNTNNKHAIVKYVQKYLNALGYNCGVADGIFGTKSHNAVLAFQKAKGLSADGIIGKNTWKKLFG